MDAWTANKLLLMEYRAELAALSETGGMFATVIGSELKYVSSFVVT